MNFFEHQDKANKKTGRLIFLFFLGLVLTIVAANAVIYGALYFAGLDNPLILDVLQEPLWLYISLGFIMVMGLGTGIKLIQISSGGLSIARMVQARPLSEGPQSFEEQQFINVVEEMAIASGTPVPQLFVMEDASINAFVAGTKMEDTVMVVTTGALNALNREELQAVVGHEFSHIFNGDMKISLKLIGVLGGLLMIGKVGHMILRVRPSRVSSSSSRKGNGVFVIILIGLGLMIVGYMGLFFGRMMKAAVSRQRELLADACSVQYTRNPRGLASAFRVMQAHEAGTHLATKSAEDISHMCFGPAQWMMFNNLLATHPPLEARIKAIDPSDQYGILPRRKPDEPESKPTQTGLEDLLPLAAGAVLEVTPQSVEATIATPGDSHVAYAMALMATIPEALRVMVRDVKQVEGVLIAMLCYNKDIPDNAHDFIAENIDRELVLPVKNAKAHLDLMDAASFLPLFELSLGAFNQLSQSQKQDIYNHGLMVLEAIDGQPFHFALLSILHNQVKDKQSKPTIHKLEPVLKEITYILAILLSCSQLSYEEQKQVFNKQISKITKRKIAYPKLSSIKYALMVKMLNRLDRVSPLGKEQIIKACIRCVLSDNKVLVAEGELLRAICEALHCPIPPIIANQTS